MKLVSGEKGPIKVGPKTLGEYLGKPFFGKEKPLSGIGVITGLAWTAMDGATLSIEATQVHSKNRGFKLTGKLGEVMRESAEIAYSYVSSHLKLFKGNPEFFDAAFVHLHVPEGATPKDGPSAGITMATALLSLARNQRIKRPLAMTGELILPEANKGDFEELPDHIREGVTAHFVSHFREVVPVVFGA